MGGLFGGSKPDNSAMLAEQERMRKQREELAAENAEKERVAAEERRMRLSGMFGTKALFSEDETGFPRKKPLGSGSSISDPNSAP